MGLHWDLTIARIRRKQPDVLRALFWVNALDLIPGHAWLMRLRVLDVIEFRLLLKLSRWLRSIGH